MDFSLGASACDSQPGEIVRMIRIGGNLFRYYKEISRIIVRLSDMDHSKIKELAQRFCFDDARYLMVWNGWDVYAPCFLIPKGLDLTLVVRSPYW